VEDRIPIDHSADHQDSALLEQALAILRRFAEKERVAAPIFDQVLLDLVRPHHRALFWGDRLLTLDKSAAFRNDPRFGDVMRQVNSSTGANQYVSPDKISWRLHTLIWAASCALRATGDFVECGVFRGDMSWALTEMIDLQGAGKKLYAYDTFEGFDPRYSSAADFPEAPQLFDFINNEYKEPDIYEAVTRRFSEKPYVKLMKGVVPDVFATEMPPSIAFLHLDMNSPKAERGALEALFGRMSRGAIIVFDDYGWILHRKQKEAADEFMNQRGYSILELPTGQGLAVLT
jgi:O-methyltransferase